MLPHNLGGVTLLIWAKWKLDATLGVRPLLQGVRRRDGQQDPHLVPKLDLPWFEVLLHNMKLIVTLPCCIHYYLGNRDIDKPCFVKDNVKIVCPSLQILAQFPRYLNKRALTSHVQDGIGHLSNTSWLECSETVETQCSYTSSFICLSWLIKLSVWGQKKPALPGLLKLLYGLFANEKVWSGL